LGQSRKDEGRNNTYKTERFIEVVDCKNETQKQYNASLLPCSKPSAHKEIDSLRSLLVLQRHTGFEKKKWCALTGRRKSERMFSSFFVE
jgi:hypothetical protein